MISAQLTARLAALLILAFVVGSCAGFTDSRMHQQKQRVHQDLFQKSYKTAALDADKLGKIARHFRESDSTSMNVLVSYDPDSDSNTATGASQTAAELAGKLRSKGVEPVSVEIVPVEETGAVSYTIIRFPVYSARGPHNCEKMPGIGMAPPNAEKVEETYKFGCTVDSLMAQQIERPRDFLERKGRPGTTASGRRSGNVIQRHLSGKPNKKLKGLSGSSE